MTRYVLDTDTLTLLQEGHPAVSRRFLNEPQEDVAITVLSIEEQLSGWYTQVRKAKKPERLAWAYRRLGETVRFFSRMQIWTYDVPAMERFEQLRKAKVRIGRSDLRIAATTLLHDAVLVTRNSRYFKKVPGLRTEDWSV